MNSFLEVVQLLEDPDGVLVLGELLLGGLGVPLLLEAVDGGPVDDEHLLVEAMLLECDHPAARHGVGLGALLVGAVVEAD